MKKSIPFLSSFSLFMVFTLSPFIWEQPNKSRAADLKTSVYASDWLEVSWSSDYGTYGQEVQAAPQLDQATLEKALVLRFIRWEATGSYFPLPLALNAEAMITMMLQPGEIEVYYYSESPLDAPAVQARYIIISPVKHSTTPYVDTKAAIRQQLQAAGVDMQKYEQVADYLGI